MFKADNVITQPDDNIYIIIQPNENIHVIIQPDDSTKRLKGQ
jgi:hypothetical protein